MNEQRRGPRQRVFKGARISSHHLGTATDCTVRNLSESGALLSVTSSIGVPDEFDLVFSDGAIKRCRAVWRTVENIGVSFLP
jgi:hypothetical protein